LQRSGFRNRATIRIKLANIAMIQLVRMLSKAENDGPRTDGLIQDFGRFPISIETDGDGLVRGRTTP
jgi:hypothetical protein